MCYILYRIRYAGKAGKRMKPPSLTMLMHFGKGAFP